MTIAVDFDGTICTNNYPNIGKPNTTFIKNLIRCRNNGWKLILWTCRTDEQLEEAVEFCRSKGLEFDAINENLPEIVEGFGGDTRKVVADMYIDDRAYSASKFIDVT